MKNFIEIVGNKFLEKYMVHVASKKTSTTYTCFVSTKFSQNSYENPCGYKHALDSLCSIRACLVLKKFPKKCYSSHYIESYDTCMEH